MDFSPLKGRPKKTYLNEENPQGEPYQEWNYYDTSYQPLYVPRQNVYGQYKVPIEKLPGLSLEPVKVPTSNLPFFLNNTNMKQLEETHSYWRELSDIKSEFLKRYTELDMSNVTVLELKQFLKNFNVCSTGKKSELISRIKDLYNSLMTIKIPNEKRDEKLDIKINETVQRQPPPSLKAYEDFDFIDF